LSNNAEKLLSAKNKKEILQVLLEFDRDTLLYSRHRAG
jgi:hypothetical protein